METIGIILLAVIAYFLWKISNQHEVEKNEVKIKKLREDREQEKKNLEKNYPHLVGKLEGNWLEVFGTQAEHGIPLLKLAFILYLQASTKIDFSEGSLKWDTLWDSTEELLEHLEKYHEGTSTEHEIAVVTYWQIAAEEIEKLTKENPEIEGDKIEVEPYINIEKITSLFPKKERHPAKEISFFDKKGAFPRESKGSQVIREKLKKLGL